MIIEGWLKEERTGSTLHERVEVRQRVITVGKIPSEEDLSPCIFLFLERILQGSICFSCLMELPLTIEREEQISLHPHSS